METIKRNVPALQAIQWKGDNMQEISDFAGASCHLGQNQAGEEALHLHFGEDGNVEVPLHAWVAKEGDAFVVIADEDCV